MKFISYGKKEEKHWNKMYDVNSWLCNWNKGNVNNRRALAT